jgi:hypothetical protein
MESATQILDLAIKAIVNNDPETLQQQLSLLFIHRLEESDSLTLLNLLLVTASINNSTDVVPTILEAWNDGIPSYGDISLFTTLFLYPQITVDALKFTAKALVDVSFLEVIDELTEMDGNDNTIIACRKALDVFGPQPRLTLETAYLNAGGVLSPEQAPVNLDNLNVAVISFLESQLAQTPILAPKPDWVKNFREEVPSEEIIFQLQPPPIVVPELTLEQEVKLLTDGLEAAGLTLDDRERSIQAITALLKTATPEQKRDLLYPVVEKETLDKLQGDIELFRLLGPANPIYDSTTEELAFGGCRMFSCAIFDFDDDTLEYYDWFTGVCDICKRGIARRQYALRMPIAPGGWTGIYCSFECLRRGVDQREEDERRPELAIRVMVDNIERQIEEIGIQDLIPLGRYVEPYLRPGSGLSERNYRNAGW